MVAHAVDLAALGPRIRKRHDLIAELADELWNSGELDKSEIVPQEGYLIYVVEAYFLLSEAYKAERFQQTPGVPPHLTEPPKIAAFTALAIMMFRPFRYVDPTRPVAQISSYVANQTFAMYCAASLLDHDFADLTFDMERRLNNFLQWANVTALGDYRGDVLIADRKDVYSIDLGRSGYTSASGGATGFSNIDHAKADLPLVDMLILFFELFWDGIELDAGSVWRED